MAIPQANKHNLPHLICFQFATIQVNTTSFLWTNKFCQGELCQSPSGWTVPSGKNLILKMSWSEIAPKWTDFPVRLGGQWCQVQHPRDNLLRKRIRGEREIGRERERERDHLTTNEALRVGLIHCGPRFCNSSITWICNSEIYASKVKVRANNYAWRKTMELKSSVERRERTVRSKKLW